MIRLSCLKQRSILNGPQGLDTVNRQGIQELLPRIETRAVHFEVAQTRGALADGFVKEAYRMRRGHQRTNTLTTRRLAKKRHVTRVTSKRSNVVLYPMQSLYDIQQSIVSRGVSGGLR